MYNRFNLTLSGDSVENSEFFFVKLDSFSINKNEFLKKQYKAFFEPNDLKWGVRISFLRDFLRDCRKRDYFLNLSGSICNYFNVNKKGYSSVELEKRKIWLDEHDSNSKGSNDLDEYSLNLNGTLLGYQRGGVSYGIDKGGRLLIADDCGLGKTVQAIALAAYYKNDFPLVIACPKSLLLNWKKEILFWLKKHGITEKDVTVFNSTGKKKVINKIIISSYSILSKNRHRIMNYIGAKGILVVDEAHNIKNYQSQTNLGIIELSHFCKRSILMTGTPVLNRPVELFSILNALDPIYWNDYYKFVYEYCDAEMQEISVPKKDGKGKRKQKILKTNGISNPTKLSKVLRNNYMVRRKKNDVLTQLPEKSRYMLYLDVDEKYNDATNEIIEKESLLISYFIYKNGKNIYESKNDYFKFKSNIKDNSLFEAYEKAGLSKVVSAAEFIEENLEAKGKIILYGHHDSFLNGVKEILLKNKNIKKSNILEINGKTSKNKINEQVEDFQNSEENKVFLLSIKAANSGLTLTSSCFLIMGEMPWTQGISIQCEDRVHRIGQKEKVGIYYLIADNRFDGHLWNLIVNKSSMSSDVLDLGLGDGMTIADENSVSGDSFISLLFDEVYNEIDLYYDKQPLASKIYKDLLELKKAL